ncbi:hypothetical protein ACWCPT_05980 [Streptomyces sp. NPDC002308]
MSAAPFSRAAAERRLGPAAVAAVRRIAAEAPALRQEQREQLRALFASARTAVPSQQADPARAA